VDCLQTSTATSYRCDTRPSCSMLHVRAIITVGTLPPPHTGMNTHPSSPLITPHTLHPRYLRQRNQGNAEKCIYHICGLRTDGVAVSIKEAGRKNACKLAVVGEQASPKCLSLFQHGLSAWDGGNQAWVECIQSVFFCAELSKT
jgi:hypothetical protein